MEEVAIPSNVLEVDHDRAKFYNEEEEVVSEVVGYNTGLRFPVPELLVALLVEYELGMTQLVPNAVLLILSSGEQDKVERLERRGGDLMGIMYFTSPAMLKAVEVYGSSSMNGEEMNRLMSRGKTVTLPEKRSKALAAHSVGERVLGGTSRSCPGGSSRAEVGPSLEQGRKRAEEVTAQKRMRVKEVAWHEVDEHGGSSVVRHALELEKVREKLASAKAATEAEVEKRRRAEEELAKARGELVEVQKKTKLEVHNSIEQPTFSEIVDLFRMLTLVMAFNDCWKKVKAQNLEVDVTKITFGPQEAGVEKDGESRTAKFRLNITLSWERDEAG
ncbi:hypothetical protein SLEP1_g55874 [Rubroshorea leprosula]|uniref:Uncharacterized protein n=1 Tax=Rubroshorea leprosula TaxID=152421 RepID=A0AAV5MKY2_9ROSI|nr:hypothetical protein SLEP1_g55874 [Rubroshorea leprosula]